MIMSKGRDPAVDRIISHMNKDHQDSLVRYLEHYHGLSSFGARNARLVDVKLHSFLITSSPSSRPAKADGPDLAHTYTIPLTPPMSSFADCRERMVALDRECVAALGRDQITVKRYVPPKGFHLVVGVTCLLTFLSLHRRSNLSPATCPQFLRPLLERFPVAAGFLYNVQPKVFWPMLAIHILEATYMAASRLKKHSVPFGSGLWWTWMASTFIEGFGNFERIDKLVNTEKQQRALKH